MGCIQLFHIRYVSVLTVIGKLAIVCFQINKLQDFEFSYCPHFASHIRVLQTFYVSYFVGSSSSSFLEMWSCSTCSIEHCAAKKTNFEGTEILFQLFRSKLSIEYKIERSLVR